MNESCVVFWGTVKSRKDFVSLKSKHHVTSGIPLCTNAHFLEYLVYYCTWLLCEMISPMQPWLIYFLWFVLLFKAYCIIELFGYFKYKDVLFPWCRCMEYIWVINVMTWRVLFGQTESKLITKYSKSWNITIGTKTLKMETVPQRCTIWTCSTAEYMPLPKKNNHLGILS